GVKAYAPGAISRIIPNGTGMTDLEPSGNIPAWSPDGNRIAVQCNGICTMNADGSGYKMITDASQSTAQDPAWSPDGTKIVFDQVDYTSSPPSPEVWVINADGSAPAKLSDYGTFPDWQP